MVNLMSLRIDYNQKCESVSLILSLGCRHDMHTRIATLTVS